MWRTDSLEKIVMLGKIEGRRRGQQRMKWLHGIIDSMDMSLSKLQEIVRDRKAWYATVHRVTKSQTWLSDWTELKCWLQIGTCQEHLPVTEEQHQHLLSACDAAAAENEALCSRETGGKGLSVQFSSVTQSCMTLCDPLDCRTPGFPVHHQLLEFT